ncbi:hypothetical protein [Actinomadura sp. 6K520]|jgi:hypothetical protein|uniref:hypothetical protein n=1 Tax=Actinomadura sp. 6K520 TaxID=2530364 RepID=UPI001051DADB|nr:hypothetical protein [Actinomadura sp. 6K520]TDE38571.1 hypothetical protein E1289_02385 [Actinomadura sp. 6K520]
MDAPSKRFKILGVLSVLLAAAIGLITNMVTSSFTWILALSLAGLVAATAALTWMERGRAVEPRGTIVTQRAQSGGSIRSGRITASSGAEVSEKAENDGRISRSKVRAEGAKIDRHADGGSIENQNIDTSS